MGLLGNTLRALADGAGGYTLGDAFSGKDAPKAKAKPKAQPKQDEVNQSKMGAATPKAQVKGFAFDPQSPSGWSYVNPHGEKAFSAAPQGHQKVMTAPGQRMNASAFYDRGAMNNMEAFQNQRGMTGAAFQSPMSLTPGFRVQQTPEPEYDSRVGMGADDFNWFYNNQRGLFPNLGDGRGNF